MTREWATKTFKSGNSVALRLPKAMGLEDGEEVVIVDHGDGSFDIRRAGTEAQLLDTLFGSFSADFMATGRGDTDQEERPGDASGPEQSRRA